MDVCVCAHNFPAFIPRHSTDMSTALLSARDCVGHWELPIGHMLVPVLQATVQWGRQWETESYRYLLIYDCDMSSKGKLRVLCTTGKLTSRKASQKLWLCYQHLTETGCLFKDLEEGTR